MNLPRSLDIAKGVWHTGAMSTRIAVSTAALCLAIAPAAQARPSLVQARTISHMVLDTYALGLDGELRILACAHKGKTSVVCRTVIDGPVRQWHRVIISEGPAARHKGTVMVVRIRPVAAPKRTPSGSLQAY